MKRFIAVLVIAATAIAAPAAAQGGLKLSVTPGEAEAGKPTLFKFRAVRGETPARGVTVRFAGRRAKTNRRGRALIRATLPRAGRYVARVGRARTTVTARKPPAPAAEDKRSPERFTGECTVKGVVKFDPPLTNTPQRITQTVNGPLGTCSGTFADAAGKEHELADVAVSETTVAVGDNMSCASATPVGPGTLFFPQGAIDFTFEEYRVGATPYVRLVGASGGSASALVTPTGPAAPHETVAKCAGEGISEVVVEGVLRADGLAG